MRHLTVFGAFSALALASPAVAKDGAMYVGIDAGLLMPNDTDFEYDGDDAVGIEYKNGYDLDIVAGYDFGFIRAEGEVSWKRASHDNLFDDDDEIDGDGDTDVRSIMLNVLGDVGNDRWAFYAGGGIGFAKVRHRFEDVDDIVDIDDDEFTLKDSGFAWQGIAGVRMAVNELIDVGLKYRYFDTREMGDDGVEWDFTSHSIMLSFIYNLGGERYVPPPPMPPPLPPAAPPPPATQTCPDGSVILATDACPPPPPPPPPMPEPERG